MTDKRLIEEAFPLRQASIDSVHEKNVRHGHISTLHIWPARRPLAACRAALIAALLPDPGDAKARQALVERIGGTLDAEGTKTTGGVLRWGRESTPDMDFFRAEIKKAYGGRAPKVLDMFAGGGAIPLEALRLGCDVTAVDYNPVAWFLLKCTLEYPQRLGGGKTWPLPGPGSASDAGLSAKQTDLGFGGGQRTLGEGMTPATGDLAAHVRYWGDWVLQRARADLAPYYPTLPFDPAKPEAHDNPLCPAVAYLWARTVPHPDATKNGLRVPLLKTLWLCKKESKKRALRLRYNADANRFDFEVFTPAKDSDVGPGTMARTGVTCPPTREGEGGTFIRADYVQRCGKGGNLGAVCTAVVVDVPRIRGAGRGVFAGKEYRLPTDVERSAGQQAVEAMARVYGEVPHGLPVDPIPQGASRTTGGSAFTVVGYGLDRWDKLFTPRQLLALGTFVKHTRAARQAMCAAYAGVPTADRDTFIEAVTAYLAIAVDRLADYDSSITHWHVSGEKMSNTFSRFALPMNWDFTEVVATSELTGGYPGGVEWITRVLEHACSVRGAGVEVVNGSATDPIGADLLDAIVSDPPYYDAIPYSDLSDFFYVWLRRTVGDAYGPVFDAPLTPKSGELVQHAGRHESQQAAKQFYENGMADAFRAACRALKPDGRMVIVFAHKQPDAWETLVGAMIRAGFVVTASWPIDTEMGNRTRAQNSAALSSSVWLVCRKRPTSAGKGWYKVVQPKMRERITERLRYFWDAGVRGPDFLWAAVGPGLEAFSTYDEVRRNDGTPFTVGEFLREVRRLTTDFALGQILQGGTEGLDEWTRYALMHAENFGSGGAPVGECILLAGEYGLDLGALTGPRGILGKGKAKAVAATEEGDEGDGEAAVGGGGSELRLLTWDERKRDDLGEPHPTGGLYYIDMMHRLMREYASGDVTRAAEYAERQGLGQNDLFWRVAQAFVEISTLQSKERTLLEAVIGWGRGRTAVPAAPKAKTMTLELAQ